MGVAPRRLWGREQKEHTEYAYDASGRLESSVTRREPEWDAEQIDLLLAYEAYMRDIGPNGEILSEATSEQAEPTYYGEGSIRYLAKGPFTNQAEKARLDAAEEYRKSLGDKANLNGMYWTVEKNTY